MPYSAKDLSIVSWGCFTEGGLAAHRNQCELHLRSLENCGCTYIFVDSGSEPAISGYRTARMNGDIPSESEAKNFGLLKTDTPLVAFTDWRTIISAETIAQTLTRINADGMPQHFVIQGYPWEMPLPIKVLVSNSEVEFLENKMHIIENVSIPHSAPKLHMGAWQVCLTEDAHAIGGWNTNLSADGAPEFHERMRCWVAVINGDNRGEIIVRNIPLVTADFSIRGEQEYRDLDWTRPLSQFVETGKASSLDWRAE